MMRKIGILIPVLFLQSMMVRAQQMNADSLVAVLSKAKEDTAKATVYEHLALTYRSTDLGKAIQYGKQGVELSKKLSFDKGIAGNSLRVSTAYAFSGKLDTALLYLDTSLVYMKKVGDLKRLGLIYLNRGDFYRQKMDMKKALLNCDTALGYADKANDDDVRARINQTMGSIYFRQLDYQAGVSYSEKAIALYQQVGNMRMSSAVLNNLGLLYKEMGEYDRSIARLGQAIHITDSLQDITNLSVYYGNLSSVYIQTEDYPLAIRYADKALEYAVMQDNQGQVAFAQSLKGNVLVKQKKYTEAIVLMHRALPVFQQIEDIDNVNISADILATAYAGTGDHAKAYEYTIIARAAGDSLTKWKYDDDIAAMQTKFMVDEKDKEIQVLAMDKEIQHEKLSRQRVLIIASIAVAILALAGIWLAVNRYRLRQRMKELELRNQIAADLHDEVGSSLSSIHMLSQMAAGKKTGDDGGDEILNRVSSNAKETMEKMSDIVWMIKPGENEGVGFVERMKRFAYEICGSKEIEYSLQTSNLGQVRLTMQQRKNIYLIFKEALNNAVKYSGASKIDINANVMERNMELVVRDNGKGFDTSTVSRGNGLENMHHRAAELGGKLEISSSKGQGSSVKLVVPV